MKRHFTTQVERLVFAFKLGVLRERRTALASFPRSGNTWVRFLLEEATGQKSGTIYHTETILPRPDRGLVIKTHHLDSFKYSRALHLVRHPLDVLDSYFHWKNDCAGQSTGSWESFVEKRIAQWVRHTEHWLAAPCEKYRVRYEDLHHDTGKQLRDMLLWLGIEVQAEDIERAVEESRLSRLRKKASKHEGKHFFRRGEVGQSHGRYTESQRAVIRARAGDTMQKLGYEPP